MLYAAHLFCPCYTRYPHVYAIELIKDCENNYWQLMKNWWSGKNIDSGPCSSCSEQSHVLRICLTCDEDHLCTLSTAERRLNIYFDRDLVNLSRHVLCSECAINHHNDHRTINIERIKHSKQDIKKATSKIILELFRQEMKNLSQTTKCRLRHERIQSIGGFMRFMLERLDYKEEGVCGYLGELIRVELITKYMADIDRKREELKLFSVGGTPCDCNRLYNELKVTRTAVNYDIIFSEICESGIGMFSPGCPLFLKSQLENRLKLYEILGETPPEQVTPEPHDVRQCPLCVILSLRKIDLRKNSRDELNLILKNVDDAFEQLKNRKTIYEAEIQGPKCECSKLWNNNQRLLKQVDKEARKPYLKFKKSMVEMAQYSLKKEIPGCPMAFDHGIVLDPIVLKELKDMDLKDSLENRDLNSGSDAVEDPCMYYNRNT
ncbi:unnamed protein product [Caenorhabditis brenneri]